MRFVYRPAAALPRLRHLGAVATAQLRPLERLVGVPLAAYASTGDRTRALLAGFDQFVSKPVEDHELGVVLAHLMGRFSA